MPAGRLGAKYSASTNPVPGSRRGWSACNSGRSGIRSAGIKTYFIGKEGFGVMRVVIFCDMEGISCIETWEQVSAGKPFYEESRKLYTDEMNAAVRGARAAGAREITVVDCHGAGGAYSFKSFLPGHLESGAQYVFGYPWARYIFPFEEGCDAILFVGAHAMAGTPDGVRSEERRVGK